MPDRPCGCPYRYTIEPHGDGYALYYGRCQHEHGYNLAYVPKDEELTLKLLRNLISPAREHAELMKEFLTELTARCVVAKRRHDKYCGGASCENYPYAKCPYRMAADILFILKIRNG